MRLTIPTDITDSPAVSDHTKHQNRWRYKAKKLAKEWNVDIDGDWSSNHGEYTVFGNSETENHKEFPYSEDHTSLMSNDWEDIHRYCEIIVDFMKEHNIKP